MLVMTLKGTRVRLGLGVERVAMLKFGIKDIRWFMENDVQFLEQFNTF
jgi:phenylalanyl-tRNA synthetase alpha chain